MSLIIKVHPHISDESANGNVDFDIGYFSSSYSDLGFDRIIYPITGKNLNYIFSGNCIQIRKKPNWEDVLKRTNEALEVFTNFVSNYGCIVVKKFYSDTQPNYINSDCDAIKVYRERTDKYSESKDLLYAVNPEGFFLVNPKFRMISIIRGRDHGGCPCSYLICEQLNKEQSVHMDCIKKLKIIIETCECILSYENPNEYQLEWSA